MSGELYNVRKIMLRGTEMSKMDSEVLSNYDDKKTVLSSYLIKQLIAKSAAKGTEFDNSITSEQEMWQIKAVEKQDITEFTIFEQEEGVKMQPIKMAGGVEVALNEVELEKVILKHTDYTLDENVNWSFSEVEDFYASVYPHQFKADIDGKREVEKLGLMVVDFSEMNLQELSEIHIPKLIKVEIPNDEGFYDKHWFIPVAMKTPTVNKSILIDAPSILVMNPAVVAKSGAETVDHYESDSLGVSGKVSEEGSFYTYTNKGVAIGDIDAFDVTISTAGCVVVGGSTITPTVGGSGSIVIDKEHEQFKFTYTDGVSESSISAKTMRYSTTSTKTEDATNVLDTVLKYCKSTEETIDVRVRVSQFACGQTSKTEGAETIITSHPLKASVSSKLVVETIAYHSNPSAFVAETGDGVVACAYTDGVVNGAVTLPIPAYYQTVCLEKLDTLEWSTPNKEMIICEKACVIVPKDAKISIDYTKMYEPDCSFNILVLEPSYLFKMSGTLNKPVDRHRYLNMEDYLMELPYRHYNNMLMDSLFTRSYENYDQTYKLVVDKDYSSSKFSYAEGVVPLAVTDSRTEGKLTADKYFLATKLVDEKQKVLKLDTSKRLKLGVEKITEESEVKPIEINLTETIEGFDVFGTDSASKVVIEVPIIDLGKNTKFVNSSPASVVPSGMSVLPAENVVIHANNFINDYDEETKTGDVVVENGLITSVPTHISSVVDDGYGAPTTGAIPAILKIDETAVGPHIKTESIREKMKVSNVVSPLTLYTLGEAGWSEEGDYTVVDASGVVKNIFSKVLVPKEGLDDFVGKEDEWRIAFAHMLRLAYAEPGTITTYLTDTSALKTDIENALKLEGVATDDPKAFHDAFADGTTVTVKLTRTAIDGTDMTAEGKKLAIDMLNAGLAEKADVFGASDEVKAIIDFY